MSNPLLDLLSESLPLPERIATWEPQLDLFVVHSDNMALLETMARAHPGDVGRLVFIWEWTRRATFLETTSLYDFRKWNMESARMVLGDCPLADVTSNKKETLFRNSIASKRLKIRCYPLIEAATLWGMERSAPNTLSPDRAAIFKRITAALKPHILAMKGVAEIYNRLESISDSIGSNMFAIHIVGFALGHPLQSAKAFLARSVVTPLPPEIDPLERFLTLADSVAAAESNLSISKTTEARTIKEFELKLKSRTIMTAEEIDDLENKYRDAGTQLLLKVLTFSGLDLGFTYAEKPQYSEKLSQDDPLNYFTYYVNPRMRDVFVPDTGWSSLFPIEKSKIWFTYLAEAENGAVRQLGCRPELNDSQYSYMLRILNASCLVDPILRGSDDFTDFLDEIVVVSSSRPLLSLRESIRKDIARAKDIARTGISNLDFYLEPYERLRKELRNLLTVGVS